MRSVGKRDAQVFRLPARVTAGEMSVSEQPSRGMAEGGITELLVAVGPLANREVPAFALVAFAADDRKRYDHPVADLQRALCSGADLHDFAHSLMPHDVTGFHAGHEMIEQVKVRTADRAAGDFDNRVSFVLDLWIGNAFRNECPLSRARPELSSRPPWFDVISHSLSNKNEVHWFLKKVGVGKVGMVKASRHGGAQ